MNWIFFKTLLEVVVDEFYMKLLNILKSAPDEHTRILIDMVSRGEETTEVRLYDGATDYGSLVDLIFEHEKVITWW